MKILRHWTKQVVCLQLHHMRGSSPPALQQMPRFPDTRATVMLVYHVALSSVCISYRAHRRLPVRYSTHPHAAHTWCTNCGCIAVVAREAGVCWKPPRSPLPLSCRKQADHLRQPYAYLQRSIHVYVSWIVRARLLHINKRQTPSMSAAVPVQTPLRSC